MRMTLILLAAASLFACGERKDHEEQAAPAMPAQLTFEGADYKDDAAKLAHGKRLADVLDCTGCHGENLQGTNVTADDPAYGDINAPNLTLLLADYSDADFDQLMHEGKPKDDREFWFMPVETYQFVGDADMTALKAFLRSFKPEGKQLPPIRKGKGFSEEIEKGIYGNSLQQVARYRAEPPEDMGPQHEWGRQLTRMVCTGCHNSKLQGYAAFTPDLDIAGAYSPEELEILLTTGKGKSKPDLGMMSAISRSKLSKLTPRERAAIIGYVIARANRQR